MQWLHPAAFNAGEFFHGAFEVVTDQTGVILFLLTEQDLDYLADFTVVHTGDNPMLKAQVAVIAGRTRASFDFGQRPPEYIDGLIRHVWCACFSASHLSADEATALADEMAALCPLVLVSEGARGAQLVRDGTRYRAVPHASSVTDSLGAGDSLIGGVLSGLITGSSPQDAMTSGTRLAARTISHFGAFGYGFDVASQPPASWVAGGVRA